MVLLDQTAQTILYLILQTFKQQENYGQNNVCSFCNSDFFLIKLKVLHLLSMEIDFFFN